MLPSYECACEKSAMDVAIEELLKRVIYITEASEDVGDFDTMVSKASSWLIHKYYFRNGWRYDQVLCRVQYKTLANAKTSVVLFISNSAVNEKRYSNTIADHLYIVNTLIKRLRQKYNGRLTVQLVDSIKIPNKIYEEQRY